MSQLLDEQYLSWLYVQVSSVKPQPPTRTYWSLLRHLYKKEFVWIIPNDDNRMEDGLDLRREFFQTTQIEADPDWTQLGCSVLEIIIAISRRLAFIAGGEPREWFWELISNLQLQGWNDQNYKGYAAKMIDEIVDAFIFRSYTFDGHGGLFPLAMAEHDQTHTEIWYQMHQYLYERES